VIATFEPGHVTIHKRKKLPHWEAQHGTQFITFRSASVIFDEQLGTHVVATLLHDDDKTYELLAYCLMPDHVHVVLRPRISIATIVQTWKSVSARHINAALKRNGRVWQEQYFDRLIRDERELRETVEYVLTNPQKRGLMDWPHVRVFAERL